MLSLILFINLFIGLRKNVYDIFFEQIGFLPRKNDLEHNTNIDIGNTFACKFSRNKNNLHMVGCSTELGEMVIENTFNYSDTTNIQFQKSMYTKFTLPIGLTMILIKIFYFFFVFSS